VVKHLGDTLLLDNDSTNEESNPVTTKPDDPAGAAVAPEEAAAPEGELHRAGSGPNRPNLDDFSRGVRLD
jgi:hypothetical protein